MQTHDRRANTPFLLSHFIRREREEEDRTTANNIRRQQQKQRTKRERKKTESTQSDGDAGVGVCARVGVGLESNSANTPFCVRSTLAVTLAVASPFALVPHSHLVIPFAPSSSSSIFLEQCTRNNLYVFIQTLRQ